MHYSPTYPAGGLTNTSIWSGPPAPGYHTSSPPPPLGFTPSYHEALMGMDKQIFGGTDTGTVHEMDAEGGERRRRNSWDERRGEGEMEKEEQGKGDNESPVVGRPERPVRP